MSAAHIAIGLILISALTNAIIGAMMKLSDDRLLFRGMIGGFSALALLPMVFFVPVPPASIWVWLVLGAGLHFTYQLAQIAAYNRGDMSLVYPVMRGIAPALAAGFAIVILKEPLSFVQWGGMGVTVLALFGFAWPQKMARIPAASAPNNNFRLAIGFAILCGILTALYTVIDAKGIRLSDALARQISEPVSSPLPLGKISYIIWLFVLDGIGIWIIILASRGRKALRGLHGKTRIGAAATTLSLICYTSALYAFSLAPIAGLAAMRELSIVFVAIIAAVWLKEDFGARRGALAIALAFGLILLHLA